MARAEAKCVEAVRPRRLPSTSAVSRVASCTLLHAGVMKNVAFGPAQDAAEAEAKSASALAALATCVAAAAALKAEEAASAAALADAVLSGGGKS